MEPFPSGTIWEDRDKKRERRELRRHPAAVAQRRRLGVVAAAASLGLFLFTLLLLGLEIRDGTEACGNALAPSWSTGVCEDRIHQQRLWSVFFLALSVGVGAWACRLRWGLGWRDVRMSDVEEA